MPGPLIYASSLIPIVLLIASQSVWPANSANDDDDLSLAYGDNSFISIATGTKLKASRAPAVATVISAEDISTAGITDFDQIMEMVPGVHVERLALYSPTYAIRGIVSQFNQQVLMLVNGLPMTIIYVGNRGNDRDAFPVKNIARVEVMRGPGSALYGADAVSGVVNIITKAADDIDSTQLGVSAGSYRSGSAWATHAGSWGPLRMAGFVQTGTTRGADPQIQADAQTRLDKVFGTHASYAPGPANLGQDSLDVQLDIAWENWRLRAAQRDRYHAGGGAGVASVLDRNGLTKTQRSTLDLSWQKSDWLKDWDASLQAAYFYYRQGEETPLTLFPPGAFNGAFPDGIIGIPSRSERHGRLTFAANYTGLGNHRLRIGSGYEVSSIYKVGDVRNFTYVYVPRVGIVPMPLGALIDVSGTASFIPTGTRRLTFAYLQDEWTLAKDWYLTGGIRHDQYSDFGGSTNPRLALVWEAAYNVTAKLLYGKAFRAPSIVELYAINNPVAQGNPALKPEKIQTLEAAISWQALPALQLGMNLFKYQLRDIINFAPNADPTTGATAQNNASQTGRGLEMEAAWDINRKLRLSVNYAYQRTLDDTSNRDAGYAPHHHFFVRSNWKVWRDWAWDTQFNWVADRKRAPGDTRPDIADYRTVDIALRRASEHGQWEFTFSVRNLFNADVREPSLAPGLLPNDLPQAGRNWYLQAAYHWR